MFDHSGNGSVRVGIVHGGEGRVVEALAARRRLPEELPAILDDGSACAVLESRPPHEPPLVAALLQSACDFLEGRLGRSASIAEEVVRSLEVTGGDDELLGPAVEHLGRVGAVLGDPVLLATSRRSAGTLAAVHRSSSTVGIASAADGAWSSVGPVRPTGTPSYRRGAANARLAATLVARAEGTLALAAADAALEDLRRTGSPREVAMTTLTAADALALLERDDEARERCRLVEHAAAKDPVVARALGEHRAWFGDSATPPLRNAAGDRQGRDGEEDADGDAVLADAGLDPAAILRATARSAVAAVATGAAETQPIVRSLGLLAGRLGATLWIAVADALERLVEGNGDLIDAIGTVPAGPLLGMIAPALVAHADRLDDASNAIVADAARANPVRWRAPLRDALRTSGPAMETEARIRAARLLALVGEPPDIGLLDAVVRSLGLRGEDGALPRTLARRVAPRLEVADLGRISVALDAQPLGPIGRRKALALLCYLVTQPDFAATREQVLEALWQDQEPETALNSLNQTIYFLRRIIERGYRERTSPQYVHHDSEVVWLDGRLVEVRSRRCRELMGIARGASPDAVRAVDELATLYVGRFALDFSYDAWADAYRESLHAGFLAAMELGISRAAEDGDLDRAIRLAERTLALDPAAEGIELSLLRLYRQAGAHAAAAEQYAHYASVLRDDLGVEPPPLDVL